ncbi:MAG: SBBP repeat-containing protein [Bacteroidetes bacterium]|nr:SBBP repeat-containing protein [Bacteroidota bacterium]
MKQLFLVTMFLACCTSALVRAQNSQESPARGLFVSQPRPAYSKPIPATATFFTIDPQAFNRVAVSGPTRIVLPDFPINTAQRGTLMLDRFQVLANNAVTVTGQLNGADRPFTPDPGIFCKGTVEEIPGSFIYLAIFHDYCSGYIEIPFGREATARFTIAPLELHDGAPSVMVTYDEHQALAMQSPQFLEGGQWHCGSEEVPGYQDAVNQVFTSMNRKDKHAQAHVQSNTLLAPQLAIECDSLFYAMHNRNLSRATNYALTVVGAMSAIYQRDVNVQFFVPFLRVWTGADPWPGTSTSTLLPQFRTYYINNMGGTQRTVAHMLSGVAIGGGIAYLNTLCNTQFGYAVSGLNNNVTYPTTAYVWDSDVISHETGHLFGSPHTHSCNWNPAIDSCYTAEGGCFAGTNPRTGTIMSYCHLTAFGTLLNFHPRVAATIRAGAESAACIGAVNNSNANDVAVSDISVPASGGAIAQNAQFTPQAVFHNSGTNTQSNLTVTLTILDSLGNTIYTNNQTITSLAAGSNASVSFAATSMGLIGRYSVVATINLGGDAFMANNTMVRPFEIVSSVSGSVTVTTPNGGGVYRSGSTVTITWTSSNITTARIDFTPDDGATWYTVRSDISAATGTLSWLVPAMPTTRARIRVANRDNLSTSDVSDQTFTIATLPLDWQWARKGGSVLDDEIQGVASDSRGNVYVCGTFNDSLWLDTVAVVSAGGTDGFVAKYSPGGWLLWARRFGGSGNDSAHSIAVDANGNVYVAGAFFGTANVGPNNLNSSGDADLLVAKYDPSGTVLWATRGGSVGRDVARAIAIDNSGNAYVAGTFAGNVTLGPSTLVSSGFQDAFIARCSPAGTFDWAQRGGSAGNDEAIGVAADGSGNCVMVGRYNAASATFGATTLTNSGGDDGFVARYSTTGAFQWAASVVGPSADDLRGAAIDNSGNVIVTGSFSSTVNIGTTVTGSIGGRDVIVIKFNSAGTLQWLRRFGGTGTDVANGVTVDGNGNIYVAGTFQDVCYVADLTMNAASGTGNDVFVVKYNPDGWPAWARRGGGARQEDGVAVTSNANGDNVYFVGRYSYTPPVDQMSVYGPDQLTGRGLNDVMIGRLGMFRVTSPVDRDEWHSSEVRNITWAACTNSTVKIEYSIDDGTTWTTIINSAPNTGSYAWTVPAVVAQRAMIRVSDADPIPMCGSAVSGTFRIISILPPTNLIATPFNASVDLAWTAPVGATPSAYAIYRGTNPGATPATLTLLTSVSGAQTGYTDFAVVNCTEYVYAVKSVAGPNLSIFSNLDSAKPEAPRTMIAQNPAKGQLVPAGSSQTIRWTSTGCIDSVRVELWTERTGTWAPISASTGNNGTLAWTVPQIKSTHAMIRITAKNDASVIGVIDTFSICSATSSITTGGATSICEGDSVVLTGPPGYKIYLWSNGATTRSIAVRTSGAYTLSVADSADCGATSQPTIVTVNPNPKPKLATSKAPAICNGDSVTIDAGTGYSAYIWSTGANTHAITVRKAGTYWVRVSNDQGCANTSDSVSVTVTPELQPKVTAIGPTSFCAGDSVMLDAGSGYATYRWSTGETTPMISVKLPGNYTVVVSNGSGCSGSSAAVQVTVYPKPAKPVIARNGKGDSLTYNGAIGTLEWRRNDTVIAGVTGGTIPIVAIGTYIVSVMDANGCSATSAPFTVTDLPSSVIVEAGEGAFMLHPNPSTGLVTIETDVPANATLNVRITDLAGREVMHVEAPHVAGHCVQTLDLRSLPNGVYLLDATAGDRSWSRKLVKQ